jgi:hypothetical protein
MKILSFDALGIFALAGLSMTAQAPSRPVASEMSITGCLKRWDKDSNAPRLPAGQATLYILTNVQSTSAMATRTSYAITAGSTVSLDVHLGHKVEATGTVDALKTPAVTPPSRPATIMTPPAEPGDNTLATFNVKTLKRISDTCP